MIGAIVASLADVLEPRGAPAAHGRRKVAPRGSTNGDGGSCGRMPEDAVEERALVEAARGGDDLAFERLVRKAQDRLVRHLRASAADADEPEEVAQETLARAWQSLKGFDGRSRFYTWLFGIAQHVRFDRRRRRLARPERTGAGEGDLDGAPAAADDREPGPLARLIGEERRARLRRELDALPERQRLALLLRCVDEMSCAEIGEMLGTTPNGASLLIFRAKAELVERLPAEWLEEWRRR